MVTIVGMQLCKLCNDHVHALNNNGDSARNGLNI